MVKSPLRSWIGIVILLISLALLAVTFLPHPRTQQEIPLPPIKVPIVGVGETPAPTEPTPPPPQLIEKRLLSVDQPRSIWVGESDRIRLVLEVDPQSGVTASVEEDDRVVTAEPVDVPDLYDTHRLVVEARLDLAGAEVQPQDSISETMQRGQTVRFSWSVSPSHSGLFRGTLWVYLNLVPREGGPVDRRTLLALPIDITGRSNIFGLPVQVVRWGAAIGTLVGFIAGFPFLEKLLALLWKKIRNKSDKNSNL